MTCQNCGKRTATTHIKTILNGRLSERHLCAECAAQLGYGGLFSGLGNGLGSLLGGLAGPTEEEGLRCPGCGMRFAEFSKTGMLGCAQCYQSFRKQLLPTIQRVHGTALHKGKHPGSSALRVREEPGAMVALDPIAEKKRQLQQAVEAQEFEQAALLRDEIREMEHHG